MKWNSSTDEKSNEQRQLEGNRQSTRDAFTSAAPTSFANVSVEENEQLMNEPTTVSESQKVSSFYGADEHNLIILASLYFISLRV